jgi:hypothetical protein
MSSSIIVEPNASLPVLFVPAPTARVYATRFDPANPGNIDTQSNYLYADLIRARIWPQIPAAQLTRQTIFQVAVRSADARVPFQTRTIVAGDNLTHYLNINARFNTVAKNDYKVCHCFRRGVRVDLPSPPAGFNVYDDDDNWSDKTFHSFYPVDVEVAILDAAVPTRNFPEVYAATTTPLLDGPPGGGGGGVATNCLIEPLLRLRQRLTDKASPTRSCFRPLRPSASSTRRSPRTTGATWPTSARPPPAGASCCSI